jgi:hypothetical protein
MMSPATLILASVMALSPQEAKTGGDRIVVHVDARVELMCIIARLAGFSEYNQPNSKSPYADEVQAHFGKFRDHAVIKTIRNLRRRRGVSFDAVMSMAIHIEDTVTLAERIPFDKKPERLDQRWRVAEARDFLEKARDFVEQSQFNEFVAEHKPFYEKSAQRLRDTIKKRAYIDWFDKYLGARPGAKFFAIPGLLNGGANYGVGIRFPDGTEEITPVLGMHTFDERGVPVVDDSIAGTVVHELCHSYTNPLADKYAQQLRQAATRMYVHAGAVMKRQAYGNWQTMMRESLVRVCGVRFKHTSDGPQAANRAVAYEHGRGFQWIGELSELMTEYESNRDRYATLDAFMPKIVEFFDAYADKYEELAGKAPKVVSITPPDGATDVDPGLREVKVTFDRPMKDRAWAVVGGGDDRLPTDGSPSYDKARKVLTIPVKLEPGRRYRFWLNASPYMAFQSEEGVPLQSVKVTFKTREK